MKLSALKSFHTTKNWEVKKKKFKLLHKFKEKFQIGKQMNVLVAYEKFWFNFIYLCYQMPFYPNMRLALSWQRPLSYRNWFLYHNGLRHERIKILMTFIRTTLQNKYYATKTKNIRTTFYIYYVYFFIYFLYWFTY